MQDGDDAEGEGDGDEDAEVDVEGEGDDNDDVGSQSGGSQGSDTQDPATEQDVIKSDESEPSPSKGLPVLPTPRDEVLEASSYDIIPTIAAPQSTSVNAITATADARWVFTGGSDGYIRRYNWVDSVNGRLMLTVAQRHPFVDSVVKAAVLMSYWENWDGRSRGTSSQAGSANLSPVYSLAVQNQGLWLLSGTESGTIRLQSLRHDEGKEIALLQQHTSAVSVLTLSSDERSLLSGSWDKTVLDWDLNVGKVRTSFAAGASQVSSVESRPMSSVPVPIEAPEQIVTNGTFSFTETNDTVMLNGVDEPDEPPLLQDEPQAQISPDSLFGGDDGDDDLFGDSGAAVMSNGANMDDAFGEPDDLPQSTADEAVFDDSADQMVQVPEATDDSQHKVDDDEDAPVHMNGVVEQEENSAPSTDTVVNELPHVDALEDVTKTEPLEEQQDAPETSVSTFMATSIDGAIRIWDKRQAEPVARVQPRGNTPPWCLNACWSPDGNNIYAGRRNGTVEEYDLRKGLRGPQRTFKFPGGSGAVTAVKAMPNGRHLICASYDILRLYDLKAPQTTRSHVPFLIVPGHRTGTISQLYIDPTCSYMISTGGNRGWEGSSTEVLLGYEIGVAA